MTSNQSNKYTMYRSTVELLESNATKTTAVPAFATSLGKFDGLVDQIGEKDKERMTKTSGKGNARDEAEDSLVLGTLIVSSALTAFASSTGNAQLKGTVKISESHLRYVRTNEQINIAKMVLDLATANAAALAPFGVAQSMLDDLKARIAAYDAAAKQVTSGMAERVGARTAVSDLFIQADQVLKDELDPMMQFFRVSAPEFYNDYRASRVIKDIGVRHKTGQPPAPPTGSPN